MNAANQRQVSAQYIDDVQKTTARDVRPFILVELWAQKLHLASVFLLDINHIVRKKKSYMERKIIEFNMPFIVWQSNCNLITKPAVHTCWTDCCPSTSQHLFALPNLPHRCGAEPQLLHSFFYLESLKQIKGAVWFYCPGWWVCEFTIKRSVGHGWWDTGSDEVITSEACWSF